MINFYEMPDAHELIQISQRLTTIYWNIISNYQPLINRFTPDLVVPRRRTNDLQWQENSIHNCISGELPMLWYDVIQKIQARINLHLTKHSN